MDIYATVRPEVLGYLNKTDFFKDKPLNFLFKFNNNSYNYLTDYSNLNILVDSGAYYFNAYSQQTEGKETFEFIAKYMDFIHDTLDDPRMKGYFDMDLRHMGLHKIKKIRSKLFKITDKIIPVYHISWGEHEFKWMCKKYDYIGFPCSSNCGPEYFIPFVKYAHNHDCKIHGLGMDRDKIMNLVPFDSTDSALWIRRSITEGYYYNKHIPKNLENNTKYKQIYVRREMQNQIGRQIYYKKRWNQYNTVI